MLEADSILTSFLHPTDEAERKQLLDQLITVHAAPIICHIVQRRLVQRARQHADVFQGIEIEDVQHEVVVELVERLLALQAGKESNPIRNFRRYVIGIVLNICNDYLRAKSPTRSNLRDNLRETLVRNRKFKLWKNAENRVVCGFTEWNETGPASRSSLYSSEIEEAVRQILNLRKSGGHNSRIPFAKIITEVLTRIDQPIELDDLVEFLSTLLNIRDYSTESLDQNEMLLDRVASAGAAPDAGLLNRELLHRFWDELRRLPKHQRDTLCLTFSDCRGEDLFSLLVDAGIATPEQLQREFGLTGEEFNDLWEQLPILNNAVLAARLGTTRTQLRKWRFLGWQQIRAVFK